MAANAVSLILNANFPALPGGKGAGGGSAGKFKPGGIGAC
jgi:hypothetical protein